MRITRQPLATRSLLALAVALSLAAVACGSDGGDESGSATTVAAPESAADGVDGADFAPGVLDSGATIATFDQGGVLVHTYTNPEAGFGNTTAVIESDNAVVLIDAHFGDGPASEFRAFAESFGKPIERLIATHDHPDHIGGITPVFSDIDTYSSSGVVEAAATVGTTITSTLEQGEIEIDGITYRFDVYTDAEADEQVVITLPDQGVVATGDLVYSDFHAVMTPTFDNWLDILDTIATTDDRRPQPHRPRTRHAWWPRNPRRHHRLPRHGSNCLRRQRRRRDVQRSDDRCLPRSSGAGRVGLRFGTTLPEVLSDRRARSTNWRKPFEDDEATGQRNESRAERSRAAASIALFS